MLPSSPDESPSSPSINHQWPTTIEQVSPAIVMLRISQTRTFAGEMACTTISTGFVVDKIHGIILTNRHVITDGPITADAIFINQERVICSTLYVDPQHDFGFLQFNPSHIKHLDLVEIPLFPSGAQVGVDIRIVGSDAGERLMVLSGTISRIDRACPEYEGAQRDANTFYITAASSTSGGSSGSPVLDIQGRCVALNAGAAVLAASSYFLPLFSIVRALSSIQKLHQLPTRGTIHATFLHIPFDEARTLGVTEEQENESRNALYAGRDFPMTGMLVVGNVIPGGPAALAQLQEGDVLLKCKDQVNVSFAELEEILDGQVDSNVLFQIRRGNITVELNIQACRFQLIDTFVEYSKGMFHACPTSHAAYYGIAVDMKGVYVSDPGYSFGRTEISSDCIFTEMNGQPINNVHDFYNVIQSCEHNAKVKIKYIDLEDKLIQKKTILAVDRKWFSLRIATRQTNVDNGLGYTWEFTQQPRSPPRVPTLLSTTTSSSSSNIDSHNNGTKSAVDNGGGTLKRSSAGVRCAGKLRPHRHPAHLKKERQPHMNSSNTAPQSLVVVTWDVPYGIDGNVGTAFEGVGVVLDTREGLVWVDRNTVVSALGDCTVIFGSSLQVPAQCVFLHPTQNLAIVKYDVTFPGLGAIPVSALKMFFPISFLNNIGDKSKQDPMGDEIQRGDSLLFVGLSAQKRIIQTPCTVVGIERLSMSTPIPPCFVSKNVEIIKCEPELSSSSIGGVCLDGTRLDCARCVVSTFSIPMQQQLEILLEDSALQVTSSAPVAGSLKLVRDGVRFIHVLGIEFGTMDIAKARELGLDGEWISKLMKVDQQATTVVVVQAVMAGSPAANVLQVGDFILQVDDDCIGVPSYFELEIRVHLAGNAKRPIGITICRDGEIMERIQVHTIPLSVLGTDRIVMFGGMQLQSTHESALFHGFLPTGLSVVAGDGEDEKKRGVYVSRFELGSPAEQANILPLRWIVQVNDIPVYNLNEFCDQVRELKTGDYVRLKTMSLSGESNVSALRVNLNYFPTTELVFDGVGNKGWQRRDLQ